MTRCNQIKFSSKVARIVFPILFLLLIAALFSNCSLVVPNATVYNETDIDLRVYDNETIYTVYAWGSITYEIAQGEHTFFAIALDRSKSDAMWSCIYIASWRPVNIKIYETYPTAQIQYE